MRVYRNRVLELYDNGMTNKTEISRRITKEFDLDSNPDAVRMQVRTIINNRAIDDECESVGIDPAKVKHYWYKGKHYSINVSGKDDFDPESFISELTEEISKWSPKYKKIKRKKTNDPHCLVFDPADIHIGKLCSSFETGEEYNSQIAVQRVKEGLEGILSKSESWNIDKIIFIAGNDILHTDNPRRQTTSMTPQDTDGMWYENFVTAKRLLIDIIETLMSVADVEVVYNPSNHDYMSGFMLLQCIESWFRKSKNVTFDNDMSHRKYTIYGKNLIGSTHMDGAKSQDLPMLMAHEASENWNDCKHRYIYGHHIHHKTSKDVFSVCIETLRSPSGSDSWHHRKGYQHAPKAVEAFIHSPEHGQVARLTHLF
jgi:hypothetical protein